MITPQKRRLSPLEQGLIVVTLVVLLLLLIGYLASFGPAKTPPVSKINPSATPNLNQTDAEALAEAKANGGTIPEMDWSVHPDEAMARMKKVAKESGGDWNKVAYRDRRIFDTVTAGYGKSWFKRLAAHPEDYK